MMADIFDTTINRWWGLLPLLALLWHGAYTAIMLDAHYLFFVCYSANLILGIGIYVRSGLMVGIGTGWCLVAFPLWLYYAVLNSDWEISCIALHCCGLLVGLALAAVAYFTTYHAVVIYRRKIYIFHLHRIERKHRRREARAAKSAGPQAKADPTGAKQD